MKFSDILGQDPIKAILTGYVEKGTLPHAILFLGDAGSQKKEIAALFQEMVLCDARGVEPCGVCESCRLIAGAGHPDSFWLRPAGKLRQVKRGQVDALLKYLALKSYRGGYKVAMIIDADRLGTSAANALLKSLEEPPPKTLFLLTASRESDLLPTILSRCQKHFLLPVTTEIITKHLEHQQPLPLPAMLLARLSLGQVGRLQGENLQSLLEIRECVTSWIEDYLETGQAAVMLSVDSLLDRIENFRKKLQKEMLEALKENKEMEPDLRKRLEEEIDADVTGLVKERQDEYLQMLMEFFRDMMILQNGLPEELVLHHDLLPLFQRACPGLPALEDRLEYLDRCRQRLGGTVNTRLTLEALFVTIFDPSMSLVINT